MLLIDWFRPLNLSIGWTPIIRDLMLYQFHMEQKTGFQINHEIDCMRPQCDPRWLTFIWEILLWFWRWQWCPNESFKFCAKKHEMYDRKGLWRKDMLSAVHNERVLMRVNLDILCDCWCSWFLFSVWEWVLKLPPAFFTPHTVHTQKFSNTIDCENIGFSDFMPVNDCHDLYSKKKKKNGFRLI